MKTKKIAIPFLLTLCFSSLNFTDAYAKNIDVKRLQGDDRYGTAAAISKEGWNKSNCAVLVTSTDFPDALCATPLAKSKNAPIILVGKDTIPSNTLNELDRLEVKEVYIVGGIGVISSDIENKLMDKGIKCNRIAGKDRYETSVKVAEELGTSDGVVLAAGKNFFDALSIAPIAAKKGMPILLSEKDLLPSNIADYLKGKVIAKSYVIGGTGVLSDEVESSIPNAERIGGKDRYDTNIKVMEKFKEEINFDSVYMATDSDFPDALAGSALAAKYSSPIMLTGKTLPSVVNNYMKSQKITTVNLLGGTGVIDVKLEQSVKGLFEEGINFPDKNLERAIRNKINKPQGKILKSDVDKITKIDFMHNNIANISGIENLTNLREVYLGCNKITDVTPLRNLTNLELISLRDNHIKDITSLKNLINAKRFELSNNEIEDIASLENLTKTVDLLLNSNAISNITSLKKLTNIKILDLSNNNISDITELKNLTNLKNLLLENNHISDITSLKNLTNIEGIRLNNNKISDITSLRDLINVNYLFLANNKISDITPLKKLTNMQYLFLEGNAISNEHQNALREALPNCEIIY